jgi:hypothetical protein
MHVCAPKEKKSGSVSVQIISKTRGKYKVLQTIGSSSDPQKISALADQDRFEVRRLQRQSSLFISRDNSVVEGFLAR